MIDASEMNPCLTVFENAQISYWVVDITVYLA